MNREVFIDELRKELSKLPEEEVEAAVEYYEEYFDEAGEDNEDNVIKALGNPKKVAGQIKSEYAVKLLDDDDIPVAKKGFAAAKWIIIGICSAPVSIPLIIVFLCIAIAAIAVFKLCRRNNRMSDRSGGSQHRMSRDRSACNSSGAGDCLSVHRDRPHGTGRICRFGIFSCKGD